MHHPNLDLHIEFSRKVAKILSYAALSQIRNLGSYVHPQRTFADNQWAWKNEKIDQYNEVALDLMKSRGIPINDLYSIVMSDVDRYLSEDMLHLSEAGKDKCAEAVVIAVRKYFD